MASMQDSLQPLARSQTRLTAVTSSTNSTASGIPGPGRTVDMWISAAGRGLERLLIRAVDQFSGGPNVFVARMMLIQAGKPSCPCKEGDSGNSNNANRSYPPLDPTSVLRILMQYSSYRCDVCSQSYPDILIQHQPFLQDCSRLADYIRSTNPLHQLLAVQHVLAVVALDTKLRSVFLMLGLIDILTIVQRQYSAIEKPGKPTSSDLFDMCDYAIDVFSGVEELVMTALLERFKDSLQVDAPVTGNRNITPLLLSKNIPPSVSLYQQCFTLRGRLMRIRGFDQFFNIASGYQSSGLSDPVTQLWDLFSLGTPLCFIYNLLNPIAGNISIDPDPEEFDYQSDRAKKRAIALFAMRIKGLDNCEPFTVTDLWDHNSTDGLVKVVKTVTAIVDQLPDSVFEPISTSLPDASGAANPGQSRNEEEFGWNTIVKEFIESERKYVSDLELMQKYSDALYQSNTLVQDTLHQLFANLKNLVNFQRRFLIRLEDIAESSRHDQRWGLPLIELENEFSVYEPYCANYTSATRLMSIYEQDLLSHSMLIDAKTELPILRMKPIQRICNYPLFFELLIKTSYPSDYPHFDELKEGLGAAKRIAVKINEALRKAENAAIAQNLKIRVDDWRGHHMAKFGELLLSGFFVVNKSEVDRNYQIYLFEKILLCCKESDGTTSGGKQAGKKIQPMPDKSNTRLLLKGRIFISNVTKAVHSSSLHPYGLEVWWRGDGDLECFTMRCRHEEEMKQWRDQINRLVEEASRRKQNNGPLRSQPDLGSPWRAKQVSTAGLPQLRLSPPRDTPLARNRQDTANVFSLYSIDERSDEEIDNVSRRPRATSLTASLSSDTSLSTDEDYGSSSTSVLTTPYSLASSPLSSPPTPLSPPPKLMKAVRFNTPTDAQPFSPSLVKVRVRFKEDLFVILVPRDIEFDELFEKVVRKVRLCGGPKDGPWRLRYVDEDRDRVAMASTEDVRMAFENCRSQVDLYVSA